MKRLVLVAGGIAFATACTGPAPRAAEAPVFSTATPATTPTPQAVQAIQPLPVSAVRPIASPSPAALPLSLLAGRSGSDVRVALDLLLQENAFLIDSAVDGATNARLDELIGASNALDQNSLAFAELVGAVKGQPTARIILDAWRTQSSDLINYAQGQHTNASADLNTRGMQAAGQLATGDLTQSAAADLLRTRVQAELSLADSLIAHDSTLSTQRLSGLVQSSDDLARPLAAALASQLKDLSPQTTEGGDVDLRIHLTDSLQQYVYFTGLGMEAAADTRSADQQAYSDAAGHVADDLGRQLTEVYSTDLGSGVADRLRTETKAFLSAASGGDRQQAATDIDRSRGEIDGLLAGANQLLAPGLIAQQLRATDQPLLTAADAFAARDYGTAFARLREAARLSQKPADTLALTIVDRYPARYLNLPPSGRSHGGRFRGAARR